MKEKTKTTRKEHGGQENRPNLGQKEAQQEQRGDEQMDQMGSGGQREHDKPGQQK